MSSNEDLIEALSRLPLEYRRQIVIELIARDIAERRGEKLSHKHQKIAEFIVKETIEQLIKVTELIKKITN